MIQAVLICLHLHHVRNSNWGGIIMPVVDTCTSVYNGFCLVTEKSSNVYRNIQCCTNRYILLQIAGRSGYSSALVPLWSFSIVIVWWKESLFERGGVLLECQDIPSQV